MQWREQGYLLLRQAIPRDQAAAFLAAADEAIAAYEAEPGFAHAGSYTIVQAIWRTAGLDELIDHPGTFPTILGLMGPYLQLMGTQIYVRPAGRESDFRWHTDCRALAAADPRHRRQSAAELQGAVLPDRHPGIGPRQLLPGARQPPA